MDMIEEKKIRKRIGRKHQCRLTLVLKSKLNGRNKIIDRNKIIAINVWAMSILIYGRSILKSMTDALKSLERKIIENYFKWCTKKGQMGMWVDLLKRCVKLK